MMLFRGRAKDYWGHGKHKWVRRNVGYVEFSKAAMLDSIIPGLNTTPALGLNGKRFLNRIPEVYRSNNGGGYGEWDAEESAGRTGWKTAVYRYEDVDNNRSGMVEEEWRSIWIHPSRRELLNQDGYVRRNRRTRPPLSPDGAVVRSDDWRSLWTTSGIAGSARHLAPIAELLGLEEDHDEDLEEFQRSEESPGHTES